MKLLKFYAEWCKPCITLSKILEDFTSVPVENINIDSNQEFVTRYTIRNIPTLILGIKKHAPFRYDKLT